MADKDQDSPKKHSNTFARKGRMIFIAMRWPLLAFLLVYGITYGLMQDYNAAIHLLIKDICIAISIFTLIAITLRIVSLLYGFRKVRQFFEPQIADQVTQVVENCEPLHRSFQPKKKHVVILLHGFISSPKIFDALVEEFEENKIDYQAPLISGFGVKRMQLLFSLTENEWVRQVTEMYDVLDSQYESISVIGHSLGGTLALHLSQIRPVNHLILMSPAIFPCSTQRLHDFLATNRVMFRILPWVIPFLPVKSSARGIEENEKTRARKVFPVAPTKGVFNILRLQKKIDVKKANCQTLDLFYGTRDIAVDGQKIWEYLKRDKVPHRVHKLDETGHNPLTEQENDFVGWVVMYIINDELEWPPKLPTTNLK